MERKNEQIPDSVGMTQHPDYKSEIIALISTNLAPRRMAERLLDYHENDVAAALELMKREERSRLYAVLSAEDLARILDYAEVPSQYLGELSGKKRADVLSWLEPVTAVEYLDGLEKQERALVLDLMDSESRREVQLISSFDEDAIGSKMSTNFISVVAGSTVRQAMRELISQAAENDNISTIYVVDEEETFVGAIDLKDLIIAREGTELDSIEIGRAHV